MNHFAYPEFFWLLLLPFLIRTILFLKIDFALYYMGFVSNRCSAPPMGRRAGAYQKL